MGNYKIGDIVQSADGAIMNVYSICDDGLICDWFDEDQNPLREKFKEDVVGAPTKDIDGNWHYCKLVSKDYDRKNRWTPKKIGSLSDATPSR